MVKVIFVQNIEDHKVGDVKDVADGYARNYLFRRGIAKPATEEELKNIEQQLAKLQKEEEKHVKEAEAIAEKLAKADIVLAEEVNEEGHLYGSVSNREVAEKLEDLGFEIEPANIEIDEPIKDLGEHEINVKVGHGVETKIKVKIERSK